MCIGVDEIKVKAITLNVLLNIHDATFNHFRSECSEPWEEVRKRIRKRSKEGEEGTVHVCQQHFNNPTNYKLFTLTIIKLKMNI